VSFELFFELIVMSGFFERSPISMAVVVRAGVPHIGALSHSSKTRMKRGLSEARSAEFRSAGFLTNGAEVGNPRADDDCLSLTTKSTTKRDSATTRGMTRGRQEGRSNAGMAVFARNADQTHKIKYKKKPGNSRAFFVTAVV
jgi:hypothetical protein